MAKPDPAPEIAAPKGTIKLNLPIQAKVMPTPKTPSRKLTVTCKLCGMRMERNKDSKFWHCSNTDMSHRGLVTNKAVIAIVRRSTRTVPSTRSRRFVKRN